MAKQELKYKMTNDILAKMVFLKYPDLLQRLVSTLLGIEYDSIEQFLITNPEVPPTNIGDKFCTFDIKMIIDKQNIVLELQVKDEKDYLERSLYYWAKEYTSALKSGANYKDLPRTIVVSILAFTQFDCKEYHSEYRPLEVTRHTLLTDKQELHYYELPKVPKRLRADDVLGLWLNLFNAKAEDDLKKIEKMGVPVMSEAVSAYRHVSATDEFKEIERLYERARHNEASAIRNAEQRGEQRGEQRSDERWQGVVADKDAKLADKDAILADNEAKLADKDAKLADMTAEIEKLRALLDK